MISLIQYASLDAAGLQNRSTRRVNFRSKELLTEPTAKKLCYTRKFTDVTLAYKDYWKINSHKVIPGN